MRANPDHPGALHLYIHAVEAGPDPRARRGRAPTGSGRSCRRAGHMVHMPSHIYCRIGRYADAVDVNVDGGQGRPGVHGQAPARTPCTGGLYYPHNLDFIWHAASMDGRSAETLRAAREFAGVRASGHAPRDAGHGDRARGPALRAGAVRTLGGDPAPAGAAGRAPLRDRRPGATRAGLAFAATGRRAEAEGELAALRRIAGSVPPDRTLAVFFKAKAMLDLAEQRPGGGDRRAVGPDRPGRQHFLAAVAEQDGHWFTEPPPWYFPVRQSLGARAPGRRAAGRGRGGVPGRPHAEPGERLVALRAGPEPPGAGQGGRGRRRCRRASRRPGPAPT